VESTILFVKLRPLRLESLDTTAGGIGRDLLPYTPAAAIS
jgi:hypothetical protein